MLVISLALFHADTRVRRDYGRRAQKRFRERQRQKVTDMERAIADLTAQDSQLQTDKSTLQSSNELLHKVLQQKEAELQTLATQPPAPAPVVRARQRNLLCRR